MGMIVMGGWRRAGARAERSDLGFGSEHVRAARRQDPLNGEAVWR